MASVLLRLHTAGHKGPVRLQIQFNVRCEGDQVVLIHSDKDVSEDKYLWKFENKLNMFLYPKKAFNIKLQH